MAINNARIRFLRGSTKANNEQFVYAGQPYFLKGKISTTSNGDVDKSSNIDGSLYIGTSDTNNTISGLYGINVATINKGIYRLTDGTYMSTNNLIDDATHVKLAREAEQVKHYLRLQTSASATYDWNGLANRTLSDYYVDRFKDQNPIAGAKTFTSNVTLSGNTNTIQDAVFKKEDGKMVLTGLRSIYTPNQVIQLNKILNIGATHIYPVENNSIDMGNGSSYFKNLYLKGEIRSDSNSAKDITDITDATYTTESSTIKYIRKLDNDKLITNDAVYYALPQINDKKNYTSASTFYAPTSAGTKGSVLLSNGADIEPVWSTATDFGDLTALRVNLQAAKESDVYNLIFSKDPTNNSLQYSSGVGITYNPSTGTLTTSTFSGNASTATILKTSRTINGTYFNGSANITTTKWGTARTIAITDGTNVSTTVSVDGSKNITLKLPSTIKASLTGNATTSTTATKATYSAVTPATDDVNRHIPFMDIDTTNGRATLYYENVSNKNFTYNASTGEVKATKFTGSLLGNASTATKATQDESGNNIKASYGSVLVVDGDKIKLNSKSGTSLGSITVPYATKATQDGNGATIASTYVKLATPQDISATHNFIAGLNVKSDAAGTHSWNISVDSNGNLLFKYGTSTRMTLTSAGNVTFTGTITANKTITALGN